MNVKINRLDPNVPDPVESRRRAAGRLVRFVYATIVFGVLAFFVVYFGAPLSISAVPAPSHPRDMWFRFPYTVQVSHMNLVPGATVKAGEEIAAGAFTGAGQHRRNLYARAGGHRRSHGRTAHQGSGRAGIARSSRAPICA